jgi:hypothetical protein
MMGCDYYVVWELRIYYGDMLYDSSELCRHRRWFYPDEASDSEWLKITEPRVLYNKGRWVSLEMQSKYEAWVRDRMGRLDQGQQPTRVTIEEYTCR